MIELIRFSQKETFEGLSQEALSVCIGTLKLASSQISTKTVSELCTFQNIFADVSIIFNFC